MTDIANETREQFLARITANSNASVATIPKPAPIPGAPKYHFPPGSGIPVIPGTAGDGYASPFLGGVNR